MSPNLSVRMGTGTGASIWAKEKTKSRFVAAQAEAHCWRREESNLLVRRGR
ncbi:uncharacterized protein G2W53_022038 [Senna tora]|uniref:Uncharacterized protein n=1 Tax=Senna tora TaxID=362788 RepID=A0A834WNU8_9FABA|nr:uncharacterized protein G2W53_022038 [Senna tora]